MFLKLCQEEINDLLKKGLIKKSYSPWSCSAFYVEKAAEIERGVLRLVINYKPLNKVLRWIRYLIPNKRDLLNRLLKTNVFSKFDMKSGDWQIQITEEDRYKTTLLFRLDIMNGTCCLSGLRMRLLSSRTL